MAGPWEQYAAKPAGPKAGPWSQYAAPAAEPEQGLGSKVAQQGKNIGAGLVRGAGSIGATILSPIDYVHDKIDPQAGPSRNDQRRKDMDAALQDMTGADPTSLGYQGGKLAGELAGTAGAGGALANTALRVAPGLATVAPNLLRAVQTGGMSANGANLLVRGAGGAITGGASAALVNPDDALTGAAIGGVAPAVLKVAGAAGNAVGKVVRGPEQSADAMAAIKAARDAGYVIPPSQANPTLVNRALEGFSGKITTAQNASVKNQAITNAKVASEFGLSPDVKITPEVLADVRKTAGQAYDAVAGSGIVTPGQSYADALDKIVAPFQKAQQGFPNAKASPVLDLVDSLRSPSFDAGSAVAKIKELRSAADDAFRTGNTDVARASKSAAAALEDALDGHLAQTAPDALQNFRNARQTIAKTYSAEKALNSTTGNIDARKLAAQLARNKPLSGGLKEAGEFAARFPKAAQAVEGMGSLPGTSPLDYAATGGISAATGNPLMMLGVLARPAARAATLSPYLQNRLIQAPRGLPSPSGVNLLQGGYRVAPLIGGDQ